MSLLVTEQKFPKERAIKYMIKFKNRRADKLYFFKLKDVKIN